MLPSLPVSLKLVELNNSHNTDKELFLFVGLANGVLMKTAVDSITGALSDTRTRYLGKKEVNLFKVQSAGTNSIMASSAKPWLCYNYMSKYYATILNYDTLDYASSFSSEVCNEGIVAISGNTFKIFQINRFGEVFNQVVVPLRYTPRKMVINSDNNNFVIIEADQNVYSKKEKDAIKYDIAEKTNDKEYLKLKEDMIGVPESKEGKWASCIRLLDPYELKILDLMECENNEAAFSCCITSFSTNPGEKFLVVGTAIDMVLQPRSFKSAWIIVFAFKEDGRKIEFVHRVNKLFNKFRLLLKIYQVLFVSFRDVYLLV